MRPAIITKHIQLLSCTALVLALTACSPDRGSNYETASHPLLESEGSWTMVEEGGAPQMSPAEMHMNARAQVNPAQEIADADKYTAHFQPADMNEDTRYRVLRLEKRVDGMDRDFKQLLPPLKKIIVPGDELNTTITDIESRQAQMSPTPQIEERIVKTDYIKPAPRTINATPAPVEKPVIQQMSAEISVADAASAAPQAITSGTAITDVRTGEHTGKTRLVIDANGPVTYKYDVDNNEKLLLIDLSGASLNAPVQKSFGNSSFLKSYTAQSNGNNVTLAIELKKPARVVSAASLKPEGANTNHRVFFDIGAP